MLLFTGIDSALSYLSGGPVALARPGRRREQQIPGLLYADKLYVVPSHSDVSPSEDQVTHSSSPVSFKLNNRSVSLLSHRFFFSAWVLYSLAVSTVFQAFMTSSWWILGLRSRSRMWKTFLVRESVASGKKC
ncbi:hypothetical protein L798_05785 [Zootermopsis nevadensis]|uniref:Uncharacterized protein n=1 Tax=Zootermopsis nevadensis TaxID=136037 RepID=A0A067QPT7_ZOONE|nr:hypothetical protein L798_05785 [Zootermopsis nevadensis]